MNHETLTFLNRQVTRERKKKDSHPRTQRLINTNCCQVNIWSLTSLTWMLPTLRPKWINTGSIHRTSAITIGKLFVFPLDSFLSVIVAYQMCVCVYCWCLPGLGSDWDERERAKISIRLHDLGYSEKTKKRIPLRDMAAFFYSVREEQQQSRVVIQIWFKDDDYLLFRNFKVTEFMFVIR